MMPPWLRPLWTVAFLGLKGPGYLLMDKLSRTRLNVSFYRNYAGLPPEAVRALAPACFTELIRPHLFTQAPACVAEHRMAGRRVVLITGSIDFIVEPLARFLGVDDLLSPSLVERDGQFTGELSGPPVGEAEKARRIRAYAQNRELDLSASYAYGDSIADLPMLETVGYPRVVNPDRLLARRARRLGWPVMRWTAGEPLGA